MTYAFLPKERSNREYVIHNKGRRWWHHFWLSSTLKMILLSWYTVKKMTFVYWLWAWWDWANYICHAVGLLMSRYNQIQLTAISIASARTRQHKVLNTLRPRSRRGTTIPIYKKSVPEIPGFERGTHHNHRASPCFTAILTVVWPFLSVRGVLTYLQLYAAWVLADAIDAVNWIWT
jgi:hypothetical protein